MKVPEADGPAPGSVRLRFFARYREITGCEEMDLPLTEPVPLAALLEELRTKVEGLDALPAELAVAVNRRVARPGDLVAPGDELAFLPPVAGG